MATVIRTTASGKETRCKGGIIVEDGVEFHRREIGEAGERPSIAKRILIWMKTKISTLLNPIWT